ncbi:AAA family ATPase [Streptomyces sp. NPDC051665]|uniref:AAA family ATPase n=1 Tax=Streptomyces sp. NPDC051665 TaxID=3154647 RepID=UPI003444D6A5
MKLPTLLELTPEQEAVTDMPFEGQHIVTGPPGSGKTVMAIYRAWMLGTAGRPTVLITHSNLLHQYCAHVAQRLSDQFRISTFHRWLRATWQQSYEKPPPNAGTGEWSYDWIDMIRDCVRKSPVVEHLVVDEGQDLPNGFYDLCSILGVSITVFADEDQRITEEQSTIAEIATALDITQEFVPLEGNHRTTREIALLASHYEVHSRHQFLLSPEPVGIKPRVVHWGSPQSFLSDLVQYIKANPRLEIGVLCRTTEAQRAVELYLAKHGLELSMQTYVSNDVNRSSIDFSKRRVRIVNTASMKGLEFDSVFVPDLDSYSEDPSGADVRMRFHVLCTRARSELYFAYYGQKEPAIIADVPQSMLERHRS